MEGMAFHQRRRRVVGRDHQDVGLEGFEPGDEGVDLLDRPDLGLEIAVLAGRVRLFIMDIEEIVFGVMGFERVEEILASPARR